MQQGLIGIAGLARLLASGTDPAQLGPRLEAQVNREPSNADALLDLSTLIFLLGNPEQRPIALARQQQALQLRRVYRLASNTEVALRLLVIMAPGDMTANTPVDCLLEDSDVEITLVYMVPDQPLPAPLPEHDLIFVAIGESDQNQALLRQLHGAAGLASKPVVNPPHKIRLLTRDQVSVLLRAIPGVAMPATARVARGDLLKIAQDGLALTAVLDEGRFPVIIRPIASHGGKHLAKIERVADLLAYLDALPDDEFYLSNFIDYRSADGQYRKYRLVLFADRAHPCHLAISSHWMVHYFNAEMAASQAKRDEEERFMVRFERDFARRHQASLHAIYRSLGLDFLVVDCSETPDGQLLVFEVDNAAIVHALDDPKLFPYKVPQMRRVFAAFREMLMARALAWRIDHG